MPQINHFPFYGADFTQNRRNKFILIFQFKLFFACQLPYKLHLLFRPDNVLRSVTVCQLQNPEKNRVKRSEGNSGSVPCKTDIALLHLLCCGPGKCYNQNVRRIDIQAFRQIFDSLGNYRGLPRAGAGQYHHRPLIVAYRLFLCPAKFHIRLSCSCKISQKEC